MKERKWSRDGMKQIIASGWKLFDRQTNAILSGNAICNTQLSSSIRPWKETVCNGFNRPKGHLLDFDLETFRRYCMPKSIESVLKDKGREKEVILYMFFTTNRQGNIEPFCWVVTDYDNKLITYSIVVGYKQNYMKRYNAVKEALGYITA